MFVIIQLCKLTIYNWKLLFPQFQIAFLLTLAIDRHKSQELGVFSAGVAPGGGASNIWSYLLGGDIDLSITMTFISSVFALGKLIVR